MQIKKNNRSTALILAKNIKFNVYTNVIHIYILIRTHHILTKTANKKPRLK